MRDQLGAAIDIDAAVPPEHPDDDAVATQLFALPDVSGHGLKFEFRIEEVATSRTDDREQLDGCVPPGRFDHPVGGGGATFMGVCAQLDPVGALGLCCEARREVESDDFQFHACRRRYRGG